MIKVTMTKNEHDELIKELDKSCRYAIASKSISLTYQTYGEVLAHARLGAITQEEFTRYNDWLVRDTMNNGKVWSKFGT